MISMTPRLPGRAAVGFLVPILLLALVPVATSAQAVDRWGLGFHVAGSQPLGVYAGSSGPDAGHAGLGFGIELDVQRRVNSELSILLSTGFTAHPPGQGLLPSDQVAFDAGAVYLLFPALIGPRITARLGGVSVFGAIQAGVILADGPAEHNVDESNPAPEVREGYDIPASPTLALSGGIELLEGWVLGARFVATPEATFVANTRYADGSLVDVESTRAIQFADVYLGVRLF